MGSHSCNLVITKNILLITQYLKDIMKVIWKHCTDYELVQLSVHSDWEYELCTVGSLLNTFHLLCKIFLLNCFSNTKDNLSMYLTVYKLNYFSDDLYISATKKYMV